MSHLFISAAHKSSGKTTISIGLCAALRDRGLRVRPFKKGPDYIDPLWLSLASGTACLNLDFYTMSRAEIRQDFARLLRPDDIGLIEGNKGLFDGLDLDGSNSNAALATLIQAPVVLVIDARGMTRGIAPLILGHQAFDRHIKIAGVILNKVGGARHESKLRRVIEHYTDVPVVGSVRSDPELEIVERHLGLMPSNEASRAEAKIATIGRAVASQVDLDLMLSIAKKAPYPDVIEDGLIAARSHRKIPDVRIGYPRDKAFGFYYPGDLLALQAAGAKLIPFDTLADTQLPNIDGLFIGGGFPETVMYELQANAAMRAQIKAFVEAGRPVYAECGGLMYLARSLTWHGETCQMVGIIPGDVIMFDRPQGRGYVQLKETQEHCWPRLDGADPSGVIPAHEFHYSALRNLDSDLGFAYEVLRGEGINGSNDGIVYRNMLTGYTHLRDTSLNRWTQRFVAHVRSCKR